MKDRETDDAELDTAAEGVEPAAAGTGGGTGRSFTKGRLIAVGGIVAVVIAAIIAFFALRPDQPEPTPSSAPSTTTASPTPSATPADAAPAGPWLRGTYRSHINEADYEDVDLMITSDCPACDATVTGRGIATFVLHWSGAGWTTLSNVCGNPIAYTPTVVADGIVQELSYVIPPCPVGQSGTFTRIGE